MFCLMNNNESTKFWGCFYFWKPSLDKRTQVSSTTFEGNKKHMTGNMFCTTKASFIVSSDTVISRFLEMLDWLKMMVFCLEFKISVEEEHFYMLRRCKPEKETWSSLKTWRKTQKVVEKPHSVAAREADGACDSMCHIHDQEVSLWCAAASN